jgi:membrane associated rhomboid family serine protease
MMPISDDNSGHTIRPYVNYALIAVNIAVFVFLQKLGSDANFTNAFSTVPAEILTGHDIVSKGQVIMDAASGQQFEVPGLQVTPIPVFLTIITSMFMHGSIGHIAGNMLYLWVFGDNIENRLGHTRYLWFYILCGIIASLSHVFTTKFMGAGLETPSLGASGAISGVLGAYLRLFPRGRVNALLGWMVIPVPAFVALGLWIVLQLISGFGMLGGEQTGVAYAAHIGGFAAGYFLISFFDKGEPKNVQQQYAQTRQRGL